MTDRCLFSAPASFFPEVLAAAPFELVSREVWRVQDLEPDASITAWVTNTGWSFRLSDPQLDLFPKLRVVVTPSTGVDHIDLDALAGRGIQFFSLLDDRAGLEDIAASAEFAFLLLLNTLRRLPVAVDGALRRMWRRDDEDLFRGRELQGRRIGLVGMGRIGRRLAAYCHAFGAEVSWFDPYVAEAQGLRRSTLAQLFDCSDSVVVCCTANTQTQGMIDGALVRRLPPAATLVNISRGEVLNEAEVARALIERSDLAAAFDVLAGEPEGRQFFSPLMALAGIGRIIVTPHVAGSSIESQTKAARIALRLVARGLAMPTESM